MPLRSAIKSVLLAILLIAGLSSAILALPTVHAQPSTLQGGGSVPRGDGLTPPNCADFPDLCKSDTQDIRTATIKVVNYFLGFLGLVCVIIIVYAGVQLVLSVGNDAAVKKAQKIIQYMVLGLLLVFLAYAIVNWAVSVFTSNGTTGGGGSPNGNGRIFTNAPNPNATPVPGTLPTGGIFTNQPNPNVTPVPGTLPTGGIYTNQPNPNVTPVPGTLPTGGIFTNQPNPNVTPVPGTLPTGGIFTNQPNPNATPVPGTLPTGGIFTNQPNPNATPVPGTLPSGGVYTNAPRPTVAGPVASPLPTGGIFGPLVPRNVNINGQIYTNPVGGSVNRNGSSSGGSSSVPSASPPPSSGSVSTQLRDLQRQLQDYINADRRDADELRRRVDAYVRGAQAGLKALPASPVIDAKVQAYRQALQDFQRDPNEATYRKVLQAQEDLTSTLDRLPQVQGAVRVSKDSGTVPLTIQFDASLSRDPTGKTIPASSYQWWYQDSNGKRVDLPRGPVVNTTFTTPNTYIVNLVIKGHGEGEETVLDALVSIPIRAEAPDGIIGFTVNGTDVSALSEIKVALEDAKRGVRLDPKPSVPRGGFRFIGAQWSYGDNSYPDIQQDNIGPVTHAFTKLGRYTVTLKLTDSGGKLLSKSVTVDVVPVVSKVSFAPRSGTTDTAFSFASASSTPGGYRSLRWTVRDASGALAKESTEERFTHSFAAPGTYTVRLEVTDNSGNVDSDEAQLSVTSKKPVARFTARQRDAESPDTFVFDGSASYDPDTNEKLSYEWLVDGSPVKLDGASSDGARGRYRFEQSGEHLVTLRVSDGTGNEVTSDVPVRVTSTLSGAVQANPRVARVGTPVSITVDAPGTAFFLFDYGDGTREQSGSGRIQHTYERSGIYTLRVTLFDTANNENTVTRKVFVADLDRPVAVATVKRSGEELRPEPNVCGTGGFRVSRSEALQFSSEESINRDGGTRLLDTSWNFSDGTVSTSRNPVHKFTRLSEGNRCYQVTLTVIDRATGKSDRGETLSFLVENDPPTLKDLSLNASASQSQGPVIVRATAIGASDPDGKVVQYRWYYHVVGSDERLGVHVTSKSNTAFTITPRQGTGETEYAFGVELTDNDGLRVNSEELLGMSERVIIPDSLDAEVEFSVTVDNPAPSVNERVSFGLEFADGQSVVGSLEGRVAWDFDGDGRPDGNANGGKATYTYTRPGTYAPSATLQTVAGPKKVATTVTVKDAASSGPVAAFLFRPLGNMVLFQSRSRGSIKSLEYDMDLQSDADGDGNPTNDVDAKEPDPMRVYPSAGTRQVRLRVTDDRGRTDDVIHQVETSDGPVTLPPNIRLDQSKPLQAILITLPEVDYRDNAIHLTSIDNRINLFAGYSRVAAGGRVVSYVIDQNIYQDTDKNGVKDDDFDNRGQASAVTGSAVTFAYAPTADQIAIKLTVIDDQNRTDSMTVPVVFDDRRSPSIGTGRTGSGSVMGQAQMDELVALVNRSNLTPDQRQRLLDALRRGDTAGIEQFKLLLDTDPNVDGATRKALLDALDGYVRAATPTVIDERYVARRRQLLIDLVNRSDLPQAKKNELVSLIAKGDERSLEEFRRFIESDATLDEAARTRLLRELDEYGRAVTYAVDIDAEIQRIKSLTLEAEPLVRIRINRSLLNLRAAYGTDARAARAELDAIRGEIDGTDRIAAVQKEQLYKSLERIAGSLNPSPIVEYPGSEAPVMGPPVPVDATPAPSNDNTNGTTPAPTPAPSTSDQPLYLRILLAIVRFVAYGIAIFFGFGLLLFLGFIIYKKSVGDDNLDFEEFILDLKGRFFGGRDQQPSEPSTPPPAIADVAASDQAEPAPQSPSPTEADETVTTSDAQAPSWLDITAPPAPGSEADAGAAPVTDDPFALPLEPSAPPAAGDAPPTPPSTGNLAEDIFGPEAVADGKSSPLDFKYELPPPEEDPFANDDLFGPLPSERRSGANDDLFGPLPASDATANPDPFAPATGDETPVSPAAMSPGDESEPGEDDEDDDDDLWNDDDDDGTEDAPNVPAGDVPPPPGQAGPTGSLEPVTTLATTVPPIVLANSDTPSSSAVSTGEPQDGPSPAVAPDTLPGGDDSALLGVPPSTLPDAAKPAPASAQASVLAGEALPESSADLNPGTIPSPNTGPSPLSTAAATQDVTPFGIEPVPATTGSGHETSVPSSENASVSTPPSLPSDQNGQPQPPNGANP